MPYLKKPFKKEAPRKINREARQKIYQSAKWRKLRQAKLMANPLCEMCLKEGKVTPAIDVHHINTFTQTADINEKYRLAFDFNNLMSLCKECHAKLHNHHNEN